MSTFIAGVQVSAEDVVTQAISRGCLAARVENWKWKGSNAKWWLLKPHHNRIHVNCNNSRTDPVTVSDSPAPTARLMSCTAVTASPAGPRNTFDIFVSSSKGTLRIVEGTTGKSRPEIGARRDSRRWPSWRYRVQNR